MSSTSPSTTPPSPPRHRRPFAALAAGAAIAVGAMWISGAAPGAGATTSSGERATYAPITPCRLTDTRPESLVGPRSTPLGTDDTLQVAARGANGECAAADLPADATALALNVTSLNATLPTFLTIYPGGTRPNASSLNPVPGQPPTPNAISVRLADDGTFSIYNLQGQVDVIVDVIGVYTDHDHDDRYDTSSEVDTKIAAESERLVIDVLLGTNGPVKQNIRDIQANENEIEQERRVAVNRMQFHPIDNTGGRSIGDDGAYVPAASGNNQLWAGVPLPTGATVTGVHARVLDQHATANIRVRFYQVAANGARQEFATTMTSSGSSSSVQTLSGTALFGNSLTTDPWATYEVRAEETGASGSWGTYNTDLQIVGFYVDYEYEVEPVL